MKARALVSSILLAVLGFGAGGARLPPTAAPPPAHEPAIKLTPAEIELYKSAQTLIDWTPSEIHHCAFLHGLQPARNQDQMPEILERVGQTCSRDVDDFLNVTSDEEVVSVRSRPHSKLRRDFHYVVLSRPIGSLPAIEEYRTDLKGHLLNSATFLDFSMITSGFASSWLLLSPEDQHGSRFRCFGTQTIRDRECYVVGFSQDPKTVRRAGHFYSQGKGHVILVQGLVWVDAQTFQALRMTMWLLTPRNDIGLIKQTSTIDFFAVRPGGTEREVWLPRDVWVEVRYRDIKVRNIHHYSNYKLFRVESTIKP